MSVAQWSRGTAMRLMRVTPVQRAAQQRLAEVQKEGLPGRFGTLYGGERALEEQTARMARRFGVKGADIKVQQAFLDRTSREYSDLETKHRLGQVSLDVIKRTANSGSATDARVYAARKMLAMEDFAKTASGAKWSSMNGSNVRSVAKGSTFTDATGTYDYSSLKGPSGTAARREAIKHVQDDKSAITDVRPGSEFDVAELKEYIDLMGGPTTYDAKELIKSVGKYRPDLVWDLSRDPAYSSMVPPAVASRSEFIKGSVNRADYETLALMPVTFWKNPTTGLTDPDFETALTEKYSRPGRSPIDKARFKAALLDEIVKTPNSTDKTAEALRMMP